MPEPVASDRACCPIIADYGGGQKTTMGGTPGVKRIERTTGRPGQGRGHVAAHYESLLQARDGPTSGMLVRAAMPT